MRRATHRASSPPSDAPRVSPAARPAAIALIAILILMPLVYYGSADALVAEGDVPRRIFAILGMGLLLLLTSLSTMPRMRWHALDLAVVGCVAALCISSIAGAYPWLSCLAPPWQEDAFPHLLSVLVFYPAARVLLGDAALRRWAAWWLVIAGGTAALLGILDVLGVLAFTPVETSRLAGTLGNPMFAGAYFAMLLPLGVALAADRAMPLRPLLWASTGVMAIALLLTQSRGALLGLAVLAGLVAAVALFGRLPGWRFPRRAWLAVAGLLLAGALTVALHPGMRARLHALTTHGLRDATVQTRLLAIQGATALFRARPLTGWGPGAAIHVFPQYRPFSTIRDLGRSVNQGYWSSLPHCEPIQVAAETGVIGLAAGLFLLGVVVRAGITRLRAGPAGGLLLGVLGLLLAHLLVHLFSYDHTATRVLFWTALGLLPACLDDTAQPGAPGTPRWPAAARIVGVIAGVLALLLGGVQLTNAWLTVRAQAAITRGRQAAATRPPVAARAADAAIADMQRVTRRTVPATAASQALLAEAYRLRMDLATDPDTAYDAYAAMQRAARHALAIMDRQPDALRLLIISALEQEDAVEARAWLTAALRVEPHCVDYRLYAAQAAALDGDYQQAVDAAESATRLAPLLPEAWQVLAHQRFLLAQHDPASSVTLADVCAGYARALALRDALPAAYRLEYATALLLTGDLNGVLREARHLRGTPEYARLLASIPSFYRMLGQPTAAARLLARLRE